MLPRKLFDEGKAIVCAQFSNILSERSVLFIQEHRMLVKAPAAEAHLI